MILLLHVYYTGKLTCDFIMLVTSYGRSYLSIKSTALAHSNNLTHLSPVHVLIGCGTASLIWGIGKSTVVKVLKSISTLHKLKRMQELMTEIISEATKFISVCYEYAGETNMTYLRFKVRLNEMGNCRLNSAPDLRVLPPTSKDFENHVYRAHYDTNIWRNFANAEPPNENPLHFVWTLDAHQNQLKPIALRSDVAPVPQQMLKMMNCGCTTCATSRCSCPAAHISCSVFFHC